MFNINWYICVGRAENNAKNYQQALKEKQQHKLESIQIGKELKRETEARKETENKVSELEDQVRQLCAAMITKVSQPKPKPKTDPNPNPNPNANPKPQPKHKP